MKMLPNQTFSRIDTLELKSMIIRKIGHERAEKYFELIRRLFSLKISKCEFNKFCIRIIGRDNLPLHNRLIKSIIKNAHLAKAPPLTSFRKPGSTLTVKVANGCKRNGDAIPQSPLTGRSAVNGDHKFRDRPSPLGPNGKPQDVAYEEAVSKAQVQQSAAELLSLGSRPPIEVASVEDGEEVEQAAGSPSIQSRSPVTAPFGISMNLGGSRKFLHNASVCRTYHLETCQNRGELPDTRSLRSRLDRKLQMEGMNASVDCVNLLNIGLDAYLKRLIEPCIRFVGMRQRETKSTCATMLDFCAAVELNPQILGEDWGIQLEKVVSRASED
ncbi:putative transcriptional coactivator Hfi1/Transcriptional adapter 1 [Rosa chinensis]|uniref:Putative transcriptional coactivator Hfi1/Transcriptional adapter 1 n=1 Tax=Rosa chinensis TaxID=74649 RepID=A0A2P6PL73_ROSCH|nr:uncharacterized protein LOC112171460 [Rosa chinensis]PRQ22688.1 putative transcriptional coactivator Hfi1/Transcriptional adapter 1 [Rosa chinensis]